MSSTAHHDGVLDSDKVYTHKAIARIVGRTADWVIKLLVRFEVNAVKVGALYFVSGADFMRAIERAAEAVANGDCDIDLE